SLNGPHRAPVKTRGHGSKSRETGSASAVFVKTLNSWQPPGPAQGGAWKNGSNRAGLSGPQLALPDRPLAPNATLSYSVRAPKGGVCPPGRGKAFCFHGVLV